MFIPLIRRTKQFGLSSAPGGTWSTLPLEPVVALNSGRYLNVGWLTNLMDIFDFLDLSCTPKKTSHFGYDVPFDLIVS